MLPNSWNPASIDDAFGGRPGGSSDAGASERPDSQEAPHPKTHEGAPTTAPSESAKSLEEQNIDARASVKEQVQGMLNTMAAREQKKKEAKAAELKAAQLKAAEQAALAPPAAAPDAAPVPRRRISSKGAPTGSTSTSTASIGGDKSKHGKDKGKHGKDKDNEELAAWEEKKMKARAANLKALPLLTQYRKRFPRKRPDRAQRMKMLPGGCPKCRYSPGCSDSCWDYKFKLNGK